MYNILMRLAAIADYYFIPFPTARFVTKGYIGYIETCNFIEIAAPNFWAWCAVADYIGSQQIRIVTLFAEKFAQSCYLAWCAGKEHFSALLQECANLGVGVANAALQIF